MVRPRWPQASRGLSHADESDVMPRVSGVRTARKLLVGIGIGLAFISICSLAALIYLSQLNAVVRHLVFDPVPGSAAIASFAKDFNQYRALEASSATLGPRDGSLTGKAADIERDLKAYDATITQIDDRRRFAELGRLWSAYGALHGEMAARKALTLSADVAMIVERQEKVSAEIDELLTTMIEWNRLEGVRSTERADSRTRAASATVLAMLVAALLLSALAFHFNRTVERPMNGLAETARAVALGNLDVRAKLDGPLEVAMVAREFNEMLDVRARAEAEARALRAALEVSREQLQRLAAGLLLAREEERTTIAREIHDILGQTLTALRMDVAWIGRRLPADMQATVEKLTQMVALIDDTVVTVQRIATDLRPGVLDDLGLAAAVEWQAQEFEQRTGIRCALRTMVDEGGLDPLVSTAVFRIFQESLTNAARHSRASRVAVTLEYRDAKLVLEVRDDGIGIAAADTSNVRSIGLIGMRERAQLVGGGCSIAGEPGAGTTVRVQIPWRREANA
jgi:signal transduction histidine kinase